VDGGKKSKTHHRVNEDSLEEKRTERKGKGDTFGGRGRVIGRKRLHPRGNVHTRRLG